VFLKVASSAAYKEGWLFDEDVVSVIRHEYDIPETKEFTYATLNRCLSTCGNLGPFLDTSDSQNMCGVFRRSTSKKKHVDGFKNKRTNRQCYYVTLPGDLPSAVKSGKDWIKHIRVIRITREKHCGVLAEAKKAFLDILHDVKVSSGKRKAVYITPGDSTRKRGRSTKHRKVSMPPAAECEVAKAKPSIAAQRQQKVHCDQGCSGQTSLSSPQRHEQSKQ